MFFFHVFVLGRDSRFHEPVTRERLDALISWANDNGFTWYAVPVPEGSQ